VDDGGAPIQGQAEDAMVLLGDGGGPAGGTEVVQPATAPVTAPAAGDGMVLLPSDSGDNPADLTVPPEDVAEPARARD
jgi:hypothetical protein